MRYLDYGSYLMYIFAKMALPDLWRISLFYLGALILCDWAASNIGWCCPLDPNTCSQAQGKTFQKSLDVIVWCLEVGSDSFDH